MNLQIAPSKWTIKNGLGVALCEIDVENGIFPLAAYAAKLGQGVTSGSLAEAGYTCEPVDPPGKKEYLGDGIYATTTDWGTMVVTTENGISVQNEIEFDSQSLVALLRYVQRITGKPLKDLL